ncbi:Crp/Fnr family transcriptional regulator [Shewanella fidelis]|uniref:Crp/Fnr family transcriptional regulator n=1 Tax=Shewanella fidelis TaxID=173509 RepID=A0AAW8NJR2_9GAMM|nr:Crp/Fnr family transcriptional regulator [Shewanella fidelis]MDR8522525.1 Crp/Fnr family transcriptional regulator [Shewanella fidelis]MDW4812941.1 Crp/Fnr family transcriptional regulator [Shewanella fidelis]MDW4816800.1 Crp/Fnr family transcriptional regulator [Shewanella fidelis]MDW4820948.1 Crp/Fnr family transcriptional regulator [Shewanella fidelis]MDW4825517.1 Crp/Fnr family transcriptional regulator [Shewanella fidelis]
MASFDRDINKVALDKAEIKRPCHHTKLIQFLTTLGLSHDAVTDALALGKHKYVPEGQILQHQDAIQTDAFFIVSGIIKACHYNDKGNDLSKEFYFTSELCFLYDSWLTHSLSQYQLETITPVQLIQLPLNLLDQPGWQTAKIALLSQQVVYKEQKEAFLLLNTPEQRYLFLLKHRPMWIEALNNIQLASYIGISAVSLSRLKARLANKQS